MLRNLIFICSTECCYNTNEADYHSTLHVCSDHFNQTGLQLVNQLALRSHSIQQLRVILSRNHTLPANHTPLYIHRTVKGLAAIISLTCLNIL